MNAIRTRPVDRVCIPVLIWVVMLAWGLAFDLVMAQGLRLVQGEADFISPDASLKLLANGSDLGAILTGDADMGCDGMVYFSDITFSNSAGSQTERGGLLAGVIRQMNPETGEIRVFRSPSGMANGIAFDAYCDMVLAEGADFGGRRITRTDMQTGIADIVAGLFEGAPFNSPNDVAIDEKGRIYFTDTRYVGHELVLQESNGVYRVDPDGHIERVVSDLPRPNGLAISPDQQTLYVSNFSNRGVDDALVAYDLDANGRASFREVLVAYPNRGADGFTVDSEGNLWVAVDDSDRPGIYAYTPEGVEKAYIELGRPWHASFGRGAQRHVLYITASNNLYQIVVKKEGYHLPLVEDPTLPDTVPDTVNVTKR